MIQIVKSRDRNYHLLYGYYGVQEGGRGTSINAEIYVA
jgi:hypothetical protein